MHTEYTARILTNVGDERDLADSTKSYNEAFMTIAKYAAANGKELRSGYDADGWHYGNDFLHIEPHTVWN